MVFTEQHQLIRKLAREFAEKELAPIAAQVDETGEFPQEVIQKMADAGFFGIKVPQELGGAGADTVSYVIVMEEITRVSAVASLYVSSPNSLSGAPSCWAARGAAKYILRCHVQPARHLLWTHRTGSRFRRRRQDDHSGGLR